MGGTFLAEPDNTWRLAGAAHTRLAWAAHSRLAWAAHNRLGGAAHTQVGMSCPVGAASDSAGVRRMENA